MAVLFKDDPEDYFEAEKCLYRKQREVDLRIELILLTSESDYSGFTETIKNTGIHIYP